MWNALSLWPFGVNVEWGNSLSVKALDDLVVYYEWLNSPKLYVYLLRITRDIGH